MGLYPVGKSVLQPRLRRLGVLGKGILPLAGPARVGTAQPHREPCPTATAGPAAPGTAFLGAFPWDNPGIKLG